MRKAFALTIVLTTVACAAVDPVEHGAAIAVGYKTSRSDHGRYIKRFREVLDAYGTGLRYYFSDEEVGVQRVPSANGVVVVGRREDSSALLVFQESDQQLMHGRIELAKAPSSRDNSPRVDTYLLIPGETQWRRYDPDDRLGSPLGDQHAYVSGSWLSGASEVIEQSGMPLAERACARVPTAKAKVSCVLGVFLLWKAPWHLGLQGVSGTIARREEEVDDPNLASLSRSCFTEEHPWVVPGQPVVNQVLYDVVVHYQEAKPVFRTYVYARDIREATEDSGTAYALWHEEEIPGERRREEEWQWASRRAALRFWKQGEEEPRVSHAFPSWEVPPSVFNHPVTCL